MISFSTSQNDGSPKFALGQIVGTPGAIKAIEDSGQSPAELLDRHVSGDWGIAKMTKAIVLRQPYFCRANTDRCTTSFSIDTRLTVVTNTILNELENDDVIYDQCIQS